MGFNNHEMAIDRESSFHMQFNSRLSQIERVASPVVVYPDSDLRDLALDYRWEIIGMQ